MLNCRVHCACFFFPSLTHLFFLNKVHESRPLDLHGLALSVVQRQDKVEEVGLAQVGGRLLLEVCPRETHAAADTSATKSPCHKNHFSFKQWVKKSV